MSDLERTRSLDVEYVPTSLDNRPRDDSSPDVCSPRTVECEMRISETRIVILVR